LINSGIKFDISENYFNSKNSDPFMCDVYSLGMILITNYDSIEDINRDRKFLLEDNREEIDSLIYSRKRTTTLNSSFEIFRNPKSIFPSNKLANIFLYGSKDKQNLNPKEIKVYSAPIAICKNETNNPQNATIRDLFNLTTEQIEKLFNTKGTITEDTKDSKEVSFVMLHSHNHRVSDYRPVQFSLKLEEDTFISVRFLLSSDWYLPKQDRIYRLSIDNQDLATQILSYFNFHSNSFNFYYEKENDTPEILYKCAFVYMNGMDLLKEVARLIDTGFIINRVFFEEGLLDYKDEDAENSERFCVKIWKRVKAEIKEYHEEIYGIQDKHGEELNPQFEDEDGQEFY